MSGNSIVNAIRRYHVARFVVSGLIGAVTGTVFVGILWLLFQLFQILI